MSCRWVHSPLDGHWVPTTESSIADYKELAVELRPAHVLAKVGVLTGVLFDMRIACDTRCPGLLGSFAACSLEKALQSLSKLNELAWRSHLPSQQKEAAQRPVVAGSGLQQQPSTTSTRRWVLLPVCTANDWKPQAFGGRMAGSLSDASVSTGNPEACDPVGSHLAAHL